MLIIIKDYNNCLTLYISSLLIFNKVVIHADLCVDLFIIIEQLFLDNRHIGCSFIRQFKQDLLWFSKSCWIHSWKCHFEKLKEFVKAKLRPRILQWIVLFTPNFTTIAFNTFD